MRVFALDSEHSANVYRPWEEGFYLTCVAGISNDGFKKVWWFDHTEIEDREPPKRYLDQIQEQINISNVVAAFNLKHDMNILRYMGVDFENVKLYCPMVVEYILSGQDVRNRQFNLDAITKHYGMEGKLDEVKEFWNKGIDTYDIPVDILEPYVLDDTQKVLDLYRVQQPLIKENKMVKLINLHNEFTRSLSDMELNGFVWNEGRAGDIYAEYYSKYNTIHEQLVRIAGESRLNLSSNAQLSAFLFGGETKVVWYEWVTKEIKKDNATRYYEKKFEEAVNLTGCGFTPPRGANTKTEGQYKTDKGTIEQLKCSTKTQREVKKLILQMSEVKKVAETIGKSGQKTGLAAKVQSDGRVHSKFNQTVTATGRLSSSDPNGQNLPRGSTSPIKECIIPRYDYICQYDLSQIEWKDAGDESGDPVMIYEINSGVDQHSASTTDLMELPLTKDNRFYAKIFNFRMIYGGSAYGFFMDHKMPDFSLKKWTKIVEDFYAKYKGLEEWQNYNIKLITEGRKLQLWTGRTFVFNKCIYKDGIWQYNERQIKNYPIQGLAGGDMLPFVVTIIRKGMRKLGLKSIMILTVHDSIVFDALKSEIAQLEKLCMNVGDNLSQYIKQYWGYETKVKRFGGEFEVGTTYGTLKPYEEWLDGD